MNTHGEEDSDDENPPVTSLPCQWKPPQKRKAVAMKVSEAHFDKLDYGKGKKYTMECLENYDPRPEELRNTKCTKVTAAKGRGSVFHYCSIPPLALTVVKSHN